MTSPQRLEQIHAFLSGTPFEGAELHPLAGDASFRRYIRLHKGDARAMLMDAPVDKEDVRPYLSVARYLHASGFSAPEILAQQPETGLLLLEDLGDDSFTRLLKGGDAALEKQLYGAAIDVLAEWHDTAKGFSDPSKLALPRYDAALLMREVGLLSEWFLPQVVGKEKATLLQPEYVAIWENIIGRSGLGTGLWVHRDYHADNLMWLPQRKNAARVGLLDFQDGVYGDAAYDLVSLLEDARRDVAPQLAEDMLRRYISASGADNEALRAAYAVLGAQRNCKIVGIFMRLAARDSKPHYLNFLPRVWGHLATDLRHPSLAPLKAWMDTHVPQEMRGVIALRHSAAELALTA
ncbi:MAG: aminoglycoside phosphotransferase [Proteobacteria bacterium]|nr:aminoglycoside phosphotransferase [Pseudomonadota bacterium]